MQFEKYVFDEEEEEKPREKHGFFRFFHWKTRAGERAERDAQREEASILPSFYTSGSSLIEEEEAERAMTKSLLERLKENPFTWYDYLIFIVEALLFILLILSLLGKIRW